MGLEFFSTGLEFFENAQKKETDLYPQLGGTSSASATRVLVVADEIAISNS